MKCPICSNTGEEFAFIECYVGSVFINRWYKEGNKEEELDEWDIDKPVLTTCGKCNFTGLPGMFEDELELPEIKEDKDGSYIDGFTTKVGSCTMQGKLYLSGTIADACKKLYRILRATTVGELPEGLSDKTSLLREAALTKFRELEEVSKNEK